MTDYLDIWLSKKVDLRQTTSDGYEFRAKRIKTYFGTRNIKIRDVDINVIEDFCVWLLKHGKVNPKTKKREPLSARSVRDCKTLLYGMFTRAEHDNLIRNNPVRDVKICAKRHKHTSGEAMLFLTEPEVEEMLRFLHADSQYRKLVPIAFVAVYYGLRRSEILGLKWDAVDFKRKQLHIRNTVVRMKRTYESATVKTDAGWRSLDLFENAETVFRTIKAQQEQNRLFYKNSYKGDGKHVFVWDDGHDYDPNYITRYFTQSMRKFGRPEITLHKLRYTCCSLLFEKGWDLKEVQAWVGHEDAETTLNVYTQFNRSRLNRDSKQLNDMSNSCMDLFLTS